MKKYKYLSLPTLVLLLGLIVQSRAVEARPGGYEVFLPITSHMNPWQELGAGSASGGGISNNPWPSNYPAIAFAPDGTHYVTWADQSSGDYQIYARRWDGSVWAEVGSGSASGGGISNVVDSDWPDIAIAPDGTPYIVWEVLESTTGPETEIYVRRWNGSAWVEVGSGSASAGGISNSPGVSRFPSIAIAPDGTPYVAWENVDSSGGDREIYVRRWDGANWVGVGAGSASGGGISNNFSFSVYVSIAIDPNGMPYVSWQDNGNGMSEQIYVRRWNGSNWVEVGSGSASGGGISNTATHSLRPEIAIAPDGTPYVTWQWDEGFPDFESSIYIRRWDGANWVEVGVGSASGYGISGGNGSSGGPSIAVTPDGNPCVAWVQFEAFGGQISDIYVLRWDGTAWEEAGLGSASGGGISVTGNSSGPVIAAHSDGTLYVAWTNSDPVLIYGEIYVRSYSE